MSKKTFTCGYCFAFYLAGEGCGCKDAQFDRAKARIKALEGVVEAAKELLVEWYSDTIREEFQEHASEIVKLYDVISQLEEGQDG